MTRANTRHISGMLQLASQSDIMSGIDWYDRAYNLAVRFIHTYDGLTMGQAVGVIAALSPNNKWERNCINAEAMIKTWAIGGDYNAIKVGTFNRNKQKAIDILSLDMESADAEAIPTILSGQKVVAFYRSIMGDKSSVCVDGHAYAIFIGERIPTTKTPSGKALGSEARPVPPRPIRLPTSPARSEPDPIRSIQGWAHCRSPS